MKFKKLLVLSLSCLLISCSGKGKDVVSESLNNGSISSSTISTEDNQVTSEEIIVLEKTSFIVSEIYTLPTDLDQVFESIDENIARIRDGKLYAVGCGKTKLRATFSGKTTDIDIEVLDSKSTNNFTYYDYENRPKGSKSLKSIGNQDVLVIPVSIKGFEENRTDENIARIHSIFNGGDDVTWESVKSFYYKSSYEKLNLNFNVVDEWFDIGLDPSELYQYASYGDGGADYVAQKALEWYKDRYSTNGTELDKNNDGYVDAIWLIYDAPNYTNYDYSENYGIRDTSGFWAFTAEVFEHYQKEDGVIGNPIINSYGWASIDFSYNFHKEGTLDTHTYIHETGHMLGLNDYYSTYYGGYNSTLETPLGCVDMMDNNIGDHNPFSKFSLGWTKPTVISDSVTIELKPFESSGDFLLLSGENYNGSAFDEYFTVEYYTPTGLNQMDAENTYADNGTPGYSNPGIRIIHVDSRLSNSAGRFVDNLEEATAHEISNTNHYGYTRYYDSAGYSPMYQLTLMQKNVGTAKTTVLSRNLAYRKGLKDGSINPDNALFHEKDFFYLARTSPYRALMPSNSNKLDRFAQSQDVGDMFNYKINIDSIDDEKAVISILKLA